MGGFREHSRTGIRSFIIALMFIVIWYYYRFGIDLNQIYKQLWQIPICFFLCYLGALFPDIDIKSKSQKFVYSIILICDIVLILLKYFEVAAWIGVAVLVVAMFKHRGFTHYFFTALIIPSPLLFIPILITGHLYDVGIPYYVSMVIGYLSHLWLDRKQQR